MFLGCKAGDLSRGEPLVTTCASYLLLRLGGGGGAVHAHGAKRTTRDLEAGGHPEEPGVQGSSTGKGPPNMAYGCEWLPPDAELAFLMGAVYDGLWLMVQPWSPSRTPTHGFLATPTQQSHGEASIVGAWVSC